MERSSQIDPGTEWHSSIDQGLLETNIVIVLLNQISTKSTYVTYEWAFALGSGKTIIPILIEECEIHSRIKILQYIDFKDGKRPWDKLIERIKELKHTENKLRVSDLNVDEFEKLFSRSNKLATEEVDRDLNENLESLEKVKMLMFYGMPNFLKKLKEEVK
jgi:hypothetical protein